VETADNMPISIAARQDRLETIEKTILQLSHQEQQDLSDWLENLIEDRLEMTNEFKAEIEAGKAEIKAGLIRVRQP
jgi:hypothetical protein